MASKVLSISLGSEVVKVCEVALAGKKKVQVYNAIDLLVPEGLCEDGVIIDAEALADAIKQGLQGEGFSARKIVFTISSKRIANKEAVIPFCKLNRIKDIVQINASEYFPITNLESYTIDYSILEVVTNESIKNYRLSVTATPNELIEQYYALAKAMGMSVESIDHSGNSILQLLKLQTAGEGVDAVLEFGAESTVVNIMNGSTMVMQRSVPYGRIAIADAVKSSRGITDDEADAVLMEEDLSALTSQYPDVADAVRSLLSSVGRILEFYRARNTEHPVERVFIIGDVSSINGLPELVNNEMDYDVEVVGSLRGVEIKNHKILSDEIVSNYLANIGAVLAPIGIALPQAGKKGKEKSGGGLPWWILIFAAVVAAAMCGGILFVYFTSKSENENLLAQINAIEDVTELQNRYDQAQADLATMESWYDTTKGANETLPRLIEDLEKVQPSAVSISKFTSQAGQVTISGFSYGKPAAAEYLIQLKKLPYISDVKIEYLNEDIENYSAHDSFQITFTLNYADPNGEDEEGSESDDADIGVADELEDIEEPAEEYSDGDEYEEVDETEEYDMEMIDGDEPVAEDEPTAEGGVE